MNILTKEARANSISFDEDNLIVSLHDGRTISVPLSYYPTLLKATKEQLNDYILSGDGIGIHWEKLDEDISIEGILLGYKSI